MVGVSAKFDLNHIVSKTALFRAWEQVASKNTAPGIDGVTVNDFSRNVTDKINRIHDDIFDNCFKPKPLVVFQSEKKDSKFRELTIPTVRDKIAAKTFSNYLVSNFDSKLLPQSYAYRYNKGAIKASRAVQNMCLNKNISHIIRVDIADFFDSIDHNLLVQTLLDIGVSRIVIDYIMIFVKNARFNGVELINPTQGIPQGSPIAPVLSNIFLNRIDKVIQREMIKFVRYADDSVFFAENSKDAMDIMSFITAELQNMGLMPSINKSRIYSVDEGFIFLGFLYTPNGKEPCREARQRLSDKISKEKYTDESENEYNKRIKSVVRGWNNYFCNSDDDNDQKNNMSNSDSLSTIKPKDQSEFEHTVSSDIENSVSMENSEKYSGKNDSKDNISLTDNSILTEKFACIEDFISCNRNAEAIAKLKALLNSEEFELSDSNRHSLLNKLADLYKKQGLYGAAEKCNGKKCDNKIKDQYNKEPVFGKNDIDNWLELFGASNDVVYRQYIDRLGRHGYRPASKSLNADYLKNHWIGNHTLAVPVYDSNNFVKFGVVDLDISRKELDTFNIDEFEKLKIRLLDDARNILDIAHKAGIEGILEDSGYKGYHVWFFFYEKLTATLVKEFLQELISQAGEPVNGTHREIFPASSTKSSNSLNFRIKLPLGIHRLSNNRSRFLAPDGSLSSGEIQLLNSKVYLTRARHLKSAVSKWTFYKKDILKEQGTTSKTDNIEILYSKCAVIRALKIKAEKEHYLSHYDRIVIRGILSNIESEGRQEIHNILSKCINYRKHTTDKMIGSEFYKPMGCNKIKEILSSLCSSIECKCKFRPKKNDYPHPLRHLGTNQDKVYKKNETDNFSRETLVQKETPNKQQPTITNNNYNNTEILNMEPSCDTKSTYKLLKQYHELRKQIIIKQNQILTILNGSETLELETGTLKFKGKDTQLKNWIIEI